MLVTFALWSKKKVNRENPTNAENQKNIVPKIYEMRQCKQQFGVLDMKMILKEIKKYGKQGN